jgi:hypothetical protein
MSNVPDNSSFKLLFFDNYVQMAMFFSSVQSRAQYLKEFYFHEDAGSQCGRCDVCSGAHLDRATFVPMANVARVLTGQKIVEQRAKGGSLICPRAGPDTIALKSVWGVLDLPKCNWRLRVPLAHFKVAADGVSSPRTKLQRPQLAAKLVHGLLDAGLLRLVRVFGFPGNKPSLQLGPFVSVSSQGEDLVSDPCSNRWLFRVPNGRKRIHCQAFTQASRQASSHHVDVAVAQSVCNMLNRRPPSSPAVALCSTAPGTQFKKKLALADVRKAAKAGVASDLTSHRLIDQVCSGTVQTLDCFGYNGVAEATIELEVPAAAIHAMFSGSDPDSILHPGFKDHLRMYLRTTIWLRGRMTRASTPKIFAVSTGIFGEGR